jgi:hypothetical protein
MFCFANRVAPCLQHILFCQQCNFLVINVLLIGKTSLLEARRYTVDKIKHVVNKKINGWQSKACCKQEDTRLAKQNI